MRPSSGTVCIGGFDVVHQPDRARSILGVMPENWGFTAILRRATTCAFLVACTRWILPGSNSGSTR
jgi:ABC-type Na+ transport system ATPase subunit NatA